MKKLGTFILKAFATIIGLIIAFYLVMLLTAW